MTTISVENYLKAIYQLAQLESPVKTKAVADSLDVSLPSVTSMMQSLSGDEMVVYTPYKGVTLTEKGRAAALSVIRKHRLVEMFLVQTLDYTWDEVHAEAEQLEHAISNELAQRMDDFLGNPSFDPHGDPIPTADGEVPPARPRPTERRLTRDDGANREGNRPRPRPASTSHQTRFGS